MKSLPDWAEAIMRHWGPQPAYGQSDPDAVALAKYIAITARFRTRWRELAEVWALFGNGRGRIVHVRQAQALLATMIDLARYGNAGEMRANRAALADLGRLDDELRTLAHEIERKIELRTELARKYALDPGLEADVIDPLAAAVRAIRGANWREPRLSSSDFAEATSGRKTTGDALKLMLLAIEGIAANLEPVKLTDEALAAIFDVAHDADAAYTPAAIKMTRSRLRGR